jgi:general secretion pathway protein L
VAVLGDAERALQAITSGWNLRQFEFAPRHRGLQSLRDALRQLTGPEWRALRVGLAALLLLQVVGLNAWAWRLDQAVQDKRGAMTQLLQASHPQVRSVLDAPVQMQRETDLLRVAAGRAGPTDFEPMLAAAAAAWPDGQGPLQKLRFEPGRLTLDTRGWGDAQRLQFADRLRAAGYGAENQGEQVLIAAAAAVADRARGLAGARTAGTPAAAAGRVAGRLVPGVDGGAAAGLAHAARRPATAGPPGRPVADHAGPGRRHP